ncbi:MAG: patatin-like phospholipase family protein [bacterium]|uniref:Patatin-like phospholipase domain protein n=2 Tax=Bacteria candidate phyla TaxID=1783234 RepID=A0A101I1D6_UNCT6|nr:MAG: Patatin-like phospholipase domain protein [candidate division TA06 bacterium 32_111]KUK86609.1 MAG: Patatin-like phospholipase domain protein [candidate division TA06 bacterium 34_109]MDI6701228.1 patatin-like phospholipase family protein [bacterium]HAF07851.1 hypothetical protein [candidate division WOR-3 bacterium]HCP17369.1 hypothetical protein [candidate division WOR-3 bacterium]
MFFLRKPKIGLALGGGSARGLAHIGVLKVLQENNIKIDLISGSSMGALIGGLYALYPDYKILLEKTNEFINSELFQQIDFKKFKQQNTDLFGNLKQKIKDTFTFIKMTQTTSLIDYKNFERIFILLFGDKKFEDTRIPFSCIAVDLVSGENIIFKKGLLYKAIMASCAIPAVFPYITYDRYILVDGGISINVPIELVKNDGADRVIASVVSAKIKKVYSFENSFQIINRAQEITKNQLLKKTINNADLLLDINLLDYEWLDFEKYDELILKGIDETKRNIEKIKKLNKGFIFKNPFKR